jgi:hypothetical protein
LDVSFSRSPISMDLTLLINKLLAQQKIDQVKHKDRYFPLLKHRSLSNKASVTDSKTTTKASKSGYRKMKRALYDHTKSLKQSDYGISLNSVLANRTNRPLLSNPNQPVPSFSLQTRENSISASFSPDLQVHHSLSLPKKREVIQGFKSSLSIHKRKPKANLENHCVPMIRAHTIIPSHRKRCASNMVDQEILTDSPPFYH